MRTLTLVFVSLLLPAVSDAVTCYTPDGAVAEGDQPCFPENPVSSCCGGSTYICATNNMCAYNSGDESGSYYVIGSCTDRSWNSPACPGYCYFRDHIHNTVFRCNDGPADTYCCADGPACNCTTGQNTQHIFDFLPPYSVLVGSAVPLSTNVITSSLFTPPGATRTPSPSVTTTSFSPTRATASSSVISSTGGAARTPSTSAATRTAQGQSSSDSGNGSDNQSLKVGLGVGISLGVVSLALAAILGKMLYDRRAKKDVPPHLEAGETKVTAAPPPYPVSIPSPSPPLVEAPGQGVVHEAPGHDVPRGRFL